MDFYFYFFNNYFLLTFYFSQVLQIQCGVFDSWAEIIPYNPDSFYSKSLTFIFSLIRVIVHVLDISEMELIAL